MSDPRPLPDSGELRDRRRNQRLMRWATIGVVLIVASLLALVAFGWFFGG